MPSVPRCAPARLFPKNSLSDGSHPTVHLACAVLACLMAWLGAAANPMEAMHIVAAKKNITVDSLTIPSQRRYIRYFDRLLKDDKPGALPQRLQRIIINTVPDFIGGGGGGAGGCVVELQVLQNGKLLWANTSVGAEAEEEQEEVADASSSKFSLDDMCMSFDIGIEAQGDVVLKCSHLALQPEPVATHDAPAGGAGST
eukprot:SAG22_NODE_6838_length_805_cov_2.118980_2_plen_198_part_01